MESCKHQNDLPLKTFLMLTYFQLHRLKRHPVVTLEAFPRARRGGYEEQLHPLERQRSDLLEKSLGQNVLADV